AVLGAETRSIPRRLHVGEGNRQQPRQVSAARGSAQGAQADPRPVRSAEWRRGAAREFLGQYQRPRQGGDPQGASPARGIIAGVAAREAGPGEGGGKTRGGT